MHDLVQDESRGRQTDISMFVYSLASVRRVSHPELTAKAEGLHMEFHIAFVLNANPVQ